MVGSLPNCYVTTNRFAVPIVVPSSSPIIPTTPKREIVLFVGPPAAGKTTFYHEYFPTKDYGYVKGNLAGCLQAAERFCNDGMGCVVGLCIPDSSLNHIYAVIVNANIDSKTRKHYVDLAKRLHSGVRYAYRSPRGPSK